MKRYLVLVFVVVIAAVAIARIPLSVALSMIGAEARGLTWTEAEGTIWNGTLRGAVFRRVPLGDATFHAKPLALLTGEARARVEAVGRGFTARGDVGVRPSGDFSVRDGVLQMDFAAVGPGLFLGAPPGGVIDVAVRKLAFADRRCAEADVSVSTDALFAPARAYDLPQRIIVSGDGRCEDGDLVLPVSGADGEEAVSATARLKPGLGYGLAVNVRTQFQELRDVLTYYGFAESPRGLSLHMTGDMIGGGA